MTTEVAVILVGEYFYSSILVRETPRYAGRNTKSTLIASIILDRNPIHDSCPPILYR